VQVGNTTSGNTRLTLGQSAEVVEVTGSAVAVNTEQATVQGVLNAQQIENLPINGRNFLDLAQLEPGVQIQDGGNFDPTKNGFSSISFGGRFGRTARIEVDALIFPTRPSAPQRRTSPLVQSRNSRSANPLSTCRQN